MHFVRTFSIVIEKVRNYEKLYLPITCLEMAGGRMHLRHPLQGFAPDVKTLFWSSPNFSRKTVALRT